MPPSQFYIGRTNEKRFKGNNSIWVWTFIAAMLGFIVLAAVLF